LDGVFVSRFGNDFLVYDQTRLGYAFGPTTLRGQLSWNANLTFDSQRQYWANFGETGRDSELQVLCCHNRRM